METEKLKNYISNIYKLEESLFLMEKLRFKVNGKIDALLNYNGKNLYCENEMPDFSEIYTDDMPNAHFMLIVLGFVLGLTISGHIVGIIIGTVCGIFLPLIVMLIIHMHKKSKVNKINKQIEEKNNQIILENEKKINLYRQMAIELKNQNKIIASKYKQTKDVLNQYYALGIIYPKYRNLVSISYIYEYLMSGRCTALEGHGGAYDVFECDKRFESITTRLDVIVNKLDQIEINQHQIYSAVKGGIKSSNQLVNSMLQNIENISNNTKINTYYNEVSARNTEFLKAIHFFEK